VTRKLVPVLAVASLALLALAVTASAHKKVFPTGVSADVVDPRAETLEVSGLVTSSKKKCIAGRKVVAVAGDKSGPSEVVGEAVTDAAGAFSFPLAKGASHVIVAIEVKQKRIPPKSKKHRHLCGVGTTGVLVH
jgi:hypothetical protein